MRSLRYLNSVLTLIAVLLTLNLWTAWAMSPAGDALSISTEAQAQGIPNAGAQRKAMVDELKKLNVELKSIQSALKSGSIRVKVDSKE